jgi:hypothetical protein
MGGLEVGLALREAAGRDPHQKIPRNEACILEGAAQPMDRARSSEGEDVSTWTKHTESLTRPR